MKLCYFKSHVTKKIELENQLQTKQVVKENSHSRYQLAAFFLLIGVFMNLLDATIVIIALPSIQIGLDASFSALHWVMAIYVMAFAAGLLPFGRLGDVIGRRRIFVLGLIGFTLASAACGFAPNIETLIAARFLQGVGGAMMTPQVLAIIHATFPNELKSKSIGAFGMVSGIAAASGPLIGGMLIALNVLDLGWRLVFLINIPLGLIAIFGALKYLPVDEVKTKAQIDWPGVVIFAGIIALFTFPLIEAEHLGWSFWFFIMLGGAVILTAVFWHWQHYLSAHNRLQTLPVTLLRKTEFLSGLGFLSCLFTGIAGVIVTFAITLQNGLGLSPMATGIVLAAHPIGAMLAASATGKFGNRWLLLRISAGVMMLLLGMVWLRLVITGTSSGAPLIAPLLIVGLGIGTATIAMFQYLLALVEPQDAGAGSGAMQTFQQIGILLGIAAIGQLFFRSLDAEESADSFTLAMHSALWVPIGIFTLLSLIAIIKTVRTGIK